MLENEFIFYTDEGYTISPKGTELDNLQVLGIEKGATKTLALKRLLENNTWIFEAGFDVKRIVSRKL